MFTIDKPTVKSAVFYGLGADGTVGANKNTVKIISEDAGLFAQGYFVYDSHKSGAQTISHLRFGPEPIHAPYLITRAGFVACHKFDFLERLDVLRLAAPGATFLLNAPYGPDEVWDRLPRLGAAADHRQEAEVLRDRCFAAARELGLGARVNTILQTCFFALSGVLPLDDAIAQIKHSIEKTYGAQGHARRADEHGRGGRRAGAAARGRGPGPASPPQREPIPLVPVERRTSSTRSPRRCSRAWATTSRSAGCPPTALSLRAPRAYEKRNVSDTVSEWRPDLCIQCGQCSFVCPHGVIRSRYYTDDALAGAPARFPSAPINTRGYPDTRFTLQVYLEDCTGCGLCVEACPAHSPVEPDTRAINMVDKQPILERERENIAFFETLPVNDRARVDFTKVSGVQYLQPLFEFPGACAGCGETPYLRLLSQLFGDRLQVANATGCSSIYGGNLPATPWTKNHEGRGPAWSNSLFEDNAEFGLGYRLAADQHLALARTLLAELASDVGEDLAAAIAGATQIEESQIRAQRERVAAPEGSAAGAARNSDERAADLLSVVDHLVRRSIWIVGGDGWAYDIGYGGLDHVLAQRSRRQRAGARHGGVFQHRRPVVQSHATRCGRQVRRGRQAHGAQGPGLAGGLVRQCLRRAGRDGRQPAAHAAGLPRSRGL